MMTYQTIDAILTHCDPALSAAEAHGIATGMLCVNSKALSNDWLAELLETDDSLADDDQILLIRLFEEVRHLLTGDDYQFDLFLPDDDAVLSEQVSALIHWCQGFLFGVGSTHLSPHFNETSREIVKDISEFTKLSTEADGENDESDFMEITEYLRTAVLLLRDELNSNNENRIH
jgi:uncharacterized protein YgfB (UPF0149 family)